MTTKQHPPGPLWQPPLSPPNEDSRSSPLRIYNSLTKTKTPFIPIDWKNRTVTWYACGPTVYDDAHLGHARNYVSTDIIRRILQDYFGYKVKFVLNITDIDDKIILRGRQQHVLKEFVRRNAASGSKIHETAVLALRNYMAMHLPLHESCPPISEIAIGIQEKYGEMVKPSYEGDPQRDMKAKIKMHIKTVTNVLEAMERFSIHQIASNEYVLGVQDVLMPYLDALHGQDIDATDHSIFTRLTKKFEARFMEDMKQLNCLDPDIVTRVTEYGEYIVQFVEKILQNGFAYVTSDGSVYFDIRAFQAANNFYARLEPWNRLDSELLADGEGSLTQKTTEKRSSSDFVLWKSSKQGEPAWPSPWGAGRPGWHIECSAMASDQFGEKMDIHSGGIDLAFPHHDNELAQSEAYWATKDHDHQHQHQWVNYFLHMGHLSIQGAKMSKSLKNFTTIREALNRGVDWTPRGLRIVFLQGGWKDGIEITTNSIRAGSVWEDKVNNFFMNVFDMLENPTSKQEPSNSEDDVFKALQKAKETTHLALCDSFCTPLAMAAISDLITAYNSANKSNINRDVVQMAALWVTSMVNTFGLDGDGRPDTEKIGWSGMFIPDEAKPYIIPLSRARDQLRRHVRSSAGITPDQVLGIYQELREGLPPDDDQNQYSILAAIAAKEIRRLTEFEHLIGATLQLCDRLRDVDLWEEGIYLEDREGEQPALVRPVTKELRATRLEKEERQEVKQKAKQLRDSEAKAKADKGRLSQTGMFKTEEFATEFTAWDEEGLPTKDTEGKAIAKSRSKKLAKDWERQKKLHEAWLTTHSTA